jgi:hypothetical protein
LRVGLRVGARVGFRVTLRVGLRVGFRVGARVTLRVTLRFGDGARFVARFGFGAALRFFAIVVSTNWREAQGSRATKSS